MSGTSGPNDRVQGDALLQATLEHLQILVGFDTRNPPREIDTGGIFEYLASQLSGFVLTMTDHGAGALSLHAVRGTPKLLFNVHVDTVPDSPAWTADPHALRVAGEHAIGLGACDIKGAAAALLAVAQASDGDMALLFSSDEEANDTRCIAGFLSEPHDYEAISVAEPTKGEAVLAHRGIQSLLLRFVGHAGHAAGAQRPADSALHQAVRWSNAALDFADAQADKSFGGLTGLRFNLGRMEGGIKANMIAPTTELRCGLRPLPSMDPDLLLRQLGALTELRPSEFIETFRGASLPAGAASRAEAHRMAALALVESLGIPVGNAVDFWTEAALFSEAGYTAFVYGPGDIAQAHSADEWVALDQLQHYAATIYRIVDRGNK